MSRDAETARTFFEQLDRTQWLSPDELRAFQHQVLARTMAHAREQVPAYRDRLAPVFAGEAFDPSRWGELPLLTKPELQANWASFQARRYPENHGLVRAVSTSGSTGQPLQIRLTELENLSRITASYRLMAWHRMDLSRPLAMIRRAQAFQAPKGSVADECWGYLWEPRERLGARLRLDISRPLEEQLAWLAEHQPSYVNTLPSHLLAIILEARERGVALPKLGGIVSVAELLTDDVRESVRNAFGCEAFDVYSSAEGGIIAHQCPQSTRLHLQAELSYVEVLDERGEPCGPGEVGEVVLTPLYNFAMPLVRYRSGDMVDVGDVCACGRGLPTINRVLGRRHHLFRLPDGSLQPPRLDREKISVALGDRAWRVVQTGADEVVFRHRAGEGMAARAEALLPELSQGMPAGFRLSAEAVPGQVHLPGEKWFHAAREYRVT